MSVEIQHDDDEAASKSKDERPGWVDKLERCGMRERACPGTFVN